MSLSPFFTHLEKPPQVKASKIFDKPLTKDSPIVTNKSPDKISPIIPETAFNTASRIPPTTTLRPSLKTSIIETIQPIIGTLSNDPETLEIAPPIPLPACIKPEYIEVRLPDEIFCKPSMTLSILAFNFLDVSDTCL